MGPCPHQLRSVPYPLRPAPPSPQVPHLSALADHVHWAMRVCAANGLGLLLSYAGRAPPAAAAAAASAAAAAAPLTPQAAAAAAAVFPQTGTDFPPEVSAAYLAAGPAAAAALVRLIQDKGAWGAVGGEAAAGRGLSHLSAVASPPPHPCPLPLQRATTCAWRPCLRVSSAPSC